MGALLVIDDDPHIRELVETLLRGADKARAFEASADDYLAKPFEGAELAMRVIRPPRHPAKAGIPAAFPGDG